MKRANKKKAEVAYFTITDTTTFDFNKGVVTTVYGTASAIKKLREDKPQKIDPDWIPKLP